MGEPRKDPTPLWHEQSAVWEIIAGELVVQDDEWSTADERSILARAGERAEQALRAHRAGDADASGHALIGCAVAGALAARHESGAPTPLREFAADLAAEVSWRAAPPSASDLDSLSRGIANRLGGGAGAPTMWELAARAGGYAAGLSPQISRRRERRDIVSTVA